MRLLVLTLAGQAIALGGLSWAGPQPAEAQARNPSHTADARDAPAREALDARVKEILSRPDYERAMRGSRRDARDAIRWLLLRLRRFLGRLGGLHETNYALFVVAVTAGLALLIAILIHITYTIVQALKPGTRPTAREGSATAPPPLSPSALIRQAEDLAARGDHRSAIRSLYLALIRSLQMRGVLPRAASQTNWEQVAHLESKPALVALVRPFARTFDEKWYGGRAADADDVARCHRWLEQTLREVETQ